MEINKPLSLSSSNPDPDDYVDQSLAEVTFGFNHLKLDANGVSDSQQLMPASPEEEEEDDDKDNDDDEGDFTFMYIGDNDSPTSAVSENGQIRPAFPLFDRSLLSDGDYDDAGRYRLSIRPPVDKVFVESPHRSPSSTASGNEDTDGVATGPYFSGTPELNKKSNSTGFSKLWRFRDKVSRSNSEGRDAFVFLNSPDRATTSSSKVDAGNVSTAKGNGAGDVSTAKVNGAGGGKAKAVKKGSKGKTATASAHEVYLKKRGAEDERRRSYLPYRPEFMGFFTNVNGGLSKNVHPF